MNFRLFSILIPALLIGCSSAPQHVEVNKPAPIRVPTAPDPVYTVDADCAMMARVSQRITVMRVQGIARDEAVLTMSWPDSFPMVGLLNQIYDYGSTNPIKNAQDVYNKCVSTGYENLVGALRAAEEEVAKKERDNMNTASHRAQSPSAQASNPSKNKKR